MIGILDYGSGNVHSATKALEAVGAECVCTRDFQILERCDGLVVPGVGAFDASMQQLRHVGADRFICDWIRSDRKFFGICVGHQILFDQGNEHGHKTPGLGIFEGSVEALTSSRLPHMGWNEVEFPHAAVFSELDGQRFYFVHSYAVHRVDGDVQVAWAQHDNDRFIAAVHRGYATSTQFHPEKSGRAGLKLLHNWLMS